jgi:hypothetical protein
LSEAGNEIIGIRTGKKVTVGVMPTWQLDDVGPDGEVLQADREPIRRLLACLIFVLIEDDVHNAAGLLGQLR